MPQARKEHRPVFVVGCPPAASWSRRAFTSLVPPGHVALPAQNWTGLRAPPPLRTLSSGLKISAQAPAGSDPAAGPHMASIAGRGYCPDIGCSRPRGQPSSRPARKHHRHSDSFHTTFLPTGPLPRPRSPDTPQDSPAVTEQPEPGPRLATPGFPRGPPAPRTVLPAPCSTCP